MRLISLLDTRAGISRGPGLVMLLAGGLILAGCAIGPLRISLSGEATQQPAIVLRSCAQARDILCVLSFGLQPPDKMTILLLASPGLPTELEVHSAWDGKAGSYPCEPTDSDASLLVCTGPLIPLGSSVRIEVEAVDGKVLIASGEFILNGLALPTVRVEGGVLQLDSVTAIPNRTRTPGATRTAGVTSSAEATRTPTPTATPNPSSTTRPTPTRRPGFPYPNPTP